MSDDLKVQIDKQNSAVWAFPAYDSVDNVRNISMSRGRDSERAEFTPGRATIDFDVDRDDTSYVLNYDESDYVNGFSRACLDYVHENESSLTIFPDVDMTFVGPTGIGRAEFNQAIGSTDMEWRLGPDVEYYARVTPHEQYVASMAVQEITAFNVSYPMIGRIYWFTKSGGFLSSDDFYTGSVTSPTTEQRVHGIAQAPAKAAYASIGSGISANLTTNAKTMRFSKFMLHAYDEAYELANGTALKPFAVDDLYSRAPDAATPVRVVLPGNQFKIKDYPQNTIGSDTTLRNQSELERAPGIYDMETLTSGTVASYFFDTRITSSVITTDSVNGTQCVRAQTEVAGSGSWGLYFTTSVGTFNVPVEPGFTYEYSVYLKNKSASPATFSMLIRADSNSALTTVLSGIVIPGSSAWTKYTGTWTAPAGVYGSYMLLTFAAANYDIYVDQYSAVQSTGIEDTRDYNQLTRIGTLEDTDAVTLKSFTVLGGTGGIFKHVTDNTAGAPSGMRFVSYSKPIGSTNNSWVLSRTVDIYPLWVEPNRVFRFSIKAKKALSTTTNIQLAYRYNTAIAGAAFSSFTAVSLTSDWEEYYWDFDIPERVTGINLSIRVQGLSTDVAEAWIDDVTFSRVPVGLNEVSTVDEATLIRTSVYDVEAPEDLATIYMSYGNDVSNDVTRIFRWQHSGRTRTRYFTDIAYAGYDLPVDTEVQGVWIGTNGRDTSIDSDSVLDIFSERGYKGVIAWDTAIPFDMPNAPGETISLDTLAPDIPWRAWTFAILFTFPDHGSYQIGYTFSDEYLGPDGYEDAPGEYENVRFTGRVDKRNDDYRSMAIGNNRFYNISLDCYDNLGVLARATLETPMRAAVLKDNPLVYLPLNDDVISDYAGRISTEPEVYTRGTPASWGVEYDSSVTLAGLANDEGGSYEFTPSGSLYSGQLIKVHDPALRASPGQGFSIGAWFRHTATASSNQYIFVQFDTRVNSIRGAFARLTSTGLDAGIFDFDSYTEYSELDTDGANHYVVVTTDGDNVFVYLDGFLLSTFPAITWSFDQTWIGGVHRSGEYQSMFEGHIGHFEMYDYCLSANQILEHWRSGNGIRGGESEKLRIEHILDLAQQPGIPPIIRTRDGDIPTPLDRMQIPSWSAGTTPTALLNEVSTTTSGQIFAGNDGQIIYENKQQRFNNGGENNQSWSIGVGQDIQPETDAGLKGGPDATKIINEAIIESIHADVIDDGIPTRRVVNDDSVTQYGRYAYNATFISDIPDTSRYTAQWLVATNGKPYPRFDQLVFSYTANAATAEFCKSVRISDHVHGSLALDNGLVAGELSGFVEYIEENISINGAKLEWYTTIEVSPAQNQRVWKLEDPTYGALDSSNRLAY